MVVQSKRGGKTANAVREQMKSNWKKYRQKHGIHHDKDAGLVAKWLADFPTRAAATANVPAPAAVHASEGAGNAVPTSTLNSEYRLDEESDDDDNNYLSEETQEDSDLDFDCISVSNHHLQEDSTLANALTRLTVQQIPKTSMNVEKKEGCFT